MGSALIQYPLFTAEDAQLLLPLGTIAVKVINA